MRGRRPSTAEILAFIGTAQICEYRLLVATIVCESYGIVGGGFEQHRSHGLSPIRSASASFRRGVPSRGSAPFAGPVRELRFPTAGDSARCSPTIPDCSAQTRPCLVHVWSQIQCHQVASNLLRRLSPRQDVAVSRPPKCKHRESVALIVHSPLSVYILFFALPAIQIRAR